MWPSFVGRSFSDLYEIAAPTFHLPRYPLYLADESRVGDFEYFYRRSLRYLSCQAARFLLFGGKFVTLADESAIDLMTDISGYWSGFYREHFPDSRGEILRYHGIDGYRTLIQQHPHYRVLTPHPYDSHYIPAKQFYLDEPALIVRLNDKGRIVELTAHVVQSEILDPFAFASDAWRERWSMPFVVKLTAASGGGDGVVLCHSEAQINEARQRFAGYTIKIEQWIGDIRNNFNVQLQVKKNGNIAFIGGSVQKVEEGKYLGNAIDLQWTPPVAVAVICDQVAKAASALGWYGVCGLDLIEDSNGELYFIDPNFRLNGSTPFFFLGDYLATQHQTPQLSTDYFCYCGTPVELFDRFRKEIQRRQLAPVGVYYDPTGDGVTRIYAAAVSDADPDEAAALAVTFAKKSLIAGIRL